MKTRPVARTAARTGIIAAIAAVIMGIFGAGMANAADKTLTWSGDFPIIGHQVMTTVVHVDIPANATRGQQLDIPVVMDVDAGTDATFGLRLTGATKVSGWVDATALVTDSAGTVTVVPVQLAIPETPTPPAGQPLKFTSTGTVSYTVPADAATGPAVTTLDTSANAHVITDGTLGTFDVPMTLDPPDQDTTLGTTNVS